MLITICHRNILLYLRMPKILVWWSTKRSFARNQQSTMNNDSKERKKKMQCGTVWKVLLIFTNLSFTLTGSEKERCAPLSFSAIVLFCFLSFFLPVKHALLAHIIFVKIIFNFRKIHRLSDPNVSLETFRKIIWRLLLECNTVL